MEDVEIGILQPATLPLVVTEVTIVVMLVEVDIGYNRPSTLPLLII